MKQLGEKKARVRDLFIEMLRQVEPGDVIAKADMIAKAGLKMPDELGTFVGMFQRARDTVRAEGIIFRSRTDQGAGLLYRFTPEEAAAILAQGRRMHSAARKRDRRGRENAIIAAKTATDAATRDLARRCVEHADRRLAVTRVKREAPVYTQPVASSDAGADPRGKRRAVVEQQTATVQ